MTTSSDSTSLQESFAKLVLDRREGPARLIEQVAAVADSTTVRSEARYFQHATAPRESACLSVLQKLNTILKLLKHSSQAPQLWFAPCIFDGSGSGKTFFNHFLLEHLREFVASRPEVAPEVKAFLNSHRVLRVWLPQCIDQQVPPDETDIKLYVAATISSQLLLEEQSDKFIRGVSVSKLLQVIGKTRTENLFLEPTMLLQAIRRVQRIPENEPFLILFGHDQMERLTSANDLTEPSRNLRNSTVHQYIVSAINFAIAAAGYNVAVFNLFTGTIPLDSTSLLPPTTYQWSPVTFDPLTPADGITLLKSQHPSLKETLQEPRISILFETFGNVPRVWELFSRELEKNPTAFSSTKSVVELCNAFAQLVERWTIPIQQLHTAILVMVQRWTMADIEALRKPEIDRVVKILLYEGRLFTREGGTFYVPLIFLRNSVKALAQEDPCREIFLEYANKCPEGTIR